MNEQKLIHLLYWPAKTRVLPNVVRAEIELRHGLVIIGSEKDEVELPHELFLRQLFRLDMTSDRDVVAFLGNYGVLVPAGVSFLPDAGEEPEASRILQQAQAESIAAPAVDGWRSVALEETRLYLRLVRDMVRVLDPKQRLASRHRRPEWLWESTWRPEPKGTDERSEFLQHYLNAALDDFRLRFVKSGERVLPRSYLYPALCLQVTNYITEYIDNSVSFRTCPECDELFVRRQTKTEKPWVGKATYCSVSCAQLAAKEREWKELKDGRVPPYIEQGRHLPAHMLKRYEPWLRNHPKEAAKYWKRREAAEAQQWLLKSGNSTTVDGK